MNTPTDQQTAEPIFGEPQLSYQTIKDASGAIQYVVVPYADFLRLNSSVETAVPNEVVERVIMSKLTPMRAWREHLGLTQCEVAARMEISQTALAQIESPEARPRKSRLRRVRASQKSRETLLSRNEETPCLVQLGLRSGKLSKPSKESPWSLPHFWTASSFRRSPLKWR